MTGASAGLLQLRVSLVLRELLSVQGGSLGSGATFAPFHVRGTGVASQGSAAPPESSETAPLAVPTAGCGARADHPTALCLDSHAAVCLS